GADTGHGVGRRVGVARLHRAGHEDGQTRAGGERLIEVERARDRCYERIDPRGAGLLQRVVDDDVAEQGVGDALNEERHTADVLDGKRVRDAVAHRGKACKLRRRQATQGETAQREIGEGRSRALRGTRLRHERGETALDTEGRQVYAFFKEFAGGRLTLTALVRVRPGDRDGPAVYDSERIAIDRVAVIEGH